ncbi:MAG TPA: hypothetical protein ENH46_07065 [Candidatus Pacearchaeota archaeon]|nr:hypothetical protein [Candidatus Pacearchaeota archaeon]
MEYSNFESKIKNIIYATYANVFDFDVKNASNGGNELKVVVTFKTSISQFIPIRVIIILKRDSGEYTTQRIYATRSEKLAGLRDSGSVDEFVDKFITSEWENRDIDKFIEDNKDIIEAEDFSLDKEDIESLLRISKERKR